MFDEESVFRQGESLNQKRRGDREGRFDYPLVAA